MTEHFYIHIPFCNQKCPYCKFALTPVFDEFKKRRYIEYLKKEIREYFQGPQAVNSMGFGERNCLSQIENSTPTVKDASFSLPNAFDTFGSKSMEEWTLKQKEIDLSSSTDTGLCRDDKKYIKTIYFGGGTPSILSHSEIREILKCFPFYNQISTEVTLESNPEDINQEYVEGLIELGINRLSMGVQTLSDKSLIEIHRSNSKSIFNALNQIGASLKKELNDDKTVNSVGFGGRNCLSQMKTEKRGAERSSFSSLNSFGTFSTKSTEDSVEKKYQKNISINIDFILGLPYTKKGETLAAIRKLHKQFPFITHTSVYMLEDENYPKHWKSNSITENEMQAEFIAIMDYFQSIGWNHYELSNWAKPGYESVHNRAYWDHSNSRGFGLSGASYEDGTRWNNASSFGKYYEGKIENEETLTNEQKEIETMMFGLRTSGFDIQNTELNISAKKIQENREKGFLEIKNTTIKPTKTGIFILDHIMSELI